MVENCLIRVNFILLLDQHGILIVISPFISHYKFSDETHEKLYFIILGEHWQMFRDCLFIFKNTSHWIVCTGEDARETKGDRRRKQKKESSSAGNNKEKVNPQKCTWLYY